MSSGENLWTGIFDAPKSTEKKTATNYQELLERLLKEVAKKVEVGEERLPQIVSAHEGVEQYSIKEHGGGGIVGAVWPEKKLLYINTRVDGEKEWTALIKHLLIHYKYPHLEHGAKFNLTTKIVDGDTCGFQTKIIDEVTKAEVEVICEFPKGHPLKHRQITGTVYNF